MLTLIIDVLVRSGRPGSLLTVAPTDPDVRVLPHPAPRQTASLRAVAYPRVQEAGRWPPPSLAARGESRSY